MAVFPPARLVELPEVTLSVHEAGEGPAVVLCHGFPELAYSWRHQVSALADAGFRAIAPDQRGYGGSSIPEKIEDYDVEHLSGDMVALLDALDIDKAVFVGHDWGGFVAWAMPVLHPDRCLGAIGVNTPYSAFPGTEPLRQIFPDPEKLYILWFQTPGVAETILDRNPRLVFEKLMRRGMKREGTLRDMADANPFRDLAALESASEELLSAEELDTYAQAFEKSGFFGGISWYRNIDRNAQRFPEIGVKKLDLPCLQITAEWDAALPPESAEPMRQTCSDLEIHMIRECGHWTQQEKPDELNRLLIDWLTRHI
jgi:pimeloyl-ACP methyl ester carboxylesterase